MQDCSISSALAMEILQSHTKPSEFTDLCLLLVVHFSCFHNTCTHMALCCFVYDILSFHCMQRHESSHQSSQSRMYWYIAASRLWSSHGRKPCGKSRLFYAMGQAIQYNTHRYQCHPEVSTAHIYTYIYIYMCVCVYGYISNCFVSSKLLHWIQSYFVVFIECHE